MSDFEINLTDVEELDSSSIGPMPAGDYEMIAQTWEAKKSKATNHRMILENKFFQKWQKKNTIMKET